MHLVPAVPIYNGSSCPTTVSKADHLHMPAKLHVSIDTVRFLLWDVVLRCIELLGIERWHIKLVSTIDNSPSPFTCGRVGWGCCVPGSTCASGWGSQPKFLSWLSGRQGLEEATMANTPRWFNTMRVQLVTETGVASTVGRTSSSETSYPIFAASDRAGHWRLLSESRNNQTSAFHTTAEPEKNDCTIIHLLGYISSNFHSLSHLQKFLHHTCHHRCHR